MLRLLVVILVPANAVWAATLYFAGFPYIAVGNTALLILLALVFGMLRSDRPLTARHLFFVSGIIFIVYAVFTSSGTGNLPNGAIHYRFLVLAVGAFYIFTDKRSYRSTFASFLGRSDFLSLNMGQ